jgi:hypothetical protein
MTNKTGKCQYLTGTTGNYFSPRPGENTKQTKVTSAKESETKPSGQTRLSFPTAGINISPTIPSGTMALKVITPNDHAGTNRIRHPSPPTNAKSPQTTRKHTPNTTKDTTTEATTTKTPPPQNNTIPSNVDPTNATPKHSTTNSTPRQNTRASTSHRFATDEIARVAAVIGTIAFRLIN